MWHRRETRRPTENTNRVLRFSGKAPEKRGNQSRAEGRGAGRWRRERNRDAVAFDDSLVSAGNG